MIQVDNPASSRQSFCQARENGTRCHTAALDTQEGACIDRYLWAGASSLRMRYYFLRPTGCRHCIFQFHDASLTIFFETVGGFPGCRWQNPVVHGHRHSCTGTLAGAGMPTRGPLSVRGKRKKDRQIDARLFLGYSLSQRNTDGGICAQRTDTFNASGSYSIFPHVTTAGADSNFQSARPAKTDVNQIPGAFASPPPPRIFFDQLHWQKIRAEICNLRRISIGDAEKQSRSFLFMPQGVRRATMRSAKRRGKLSIVLAIRGAQHGPPDL
ncbi:hypothetical protein BJ170DRAFT_600439 [Xylariales sp. AK1849]|nr:hypothetical protein BJ170DRAFT_600439 [Xylariales sp. AK1849]